MKISSGRICWQAIFVAVLCLGVRPLYAWLRGSEGKTGAAEGHWNITNEILKETPFDSTFSPKAKNILCGRSSYLDFTFLGLVDLAGWWLRWYRLDSQKPNHWEGSAVENEKRLNLYLGDAVRWANGGDVEKGLAALGDALHVGQDRGAHEHDHQLFKGNPDNRYDNPEGWEKAKEETREIFRKFLAGLTEEAKVRLKAEKN